MKPKALTAASSAAITAFLADRHARLALGDESAAHFTLRDLATAARCSISMAHAAATAAGCVGVPSKGMYLRADLAPAHPHQGLASRHRTARTAAHLRLGEAVIALGGGVWSAEALATLVGVKASSVGTIVRRALDAYAGRLRRATTASGGYEFEVVQ